MITPEFKFTLPGGLLDDAGTRHAEGIMRMATAKDEIEVQADPRVRENPAYSVLVMLSRVIISLGELPSVTPEDMENLFTLDLAYLREFYNRINQNGNAQLQVQCPKCRAEFNVELSLSGES